MYNKVYIVSHLSKNTEENIDSFSFLGGTSDIRNMWDSYYLLGRQNDKNCLRDLHTLEYYMFRNFLLKKGYKSDNIIPLINQSMFLLDDDLYLYKNNKWGKLDIENIAFLSVRGDYWHHPFFHLLKNILKNKNSLLNSLGGFSGKIQKKNKFYAYSGLYGKSNNIGHMGVPFNLKEESLDGLIDLIKEKLNKKILLKIDSTSFGMGVIPVNLGNKIHFDKFKKYILGHMKFGNEIYIVPYSKFETEYRVYFTKISGVVKIHSIKEKNITNSKKDIFKKENYKYYKNIGLKWSYIKKEDWTFELIKTIEDYINLTKYTVGNLEFGKVSKKYKKDNGKYIFFEINYMAGPGCYYGYNNEDINNMSEFYEEIFKGTLLAE
ncbi:MAG: hypothetical protein Q9M94_00645 [Candidatus Gracilibacteria bacterium]|nr:hypothetical protein [Candidatus Gracilibacteria bacterium]MDQ7023094.1 hypothetical protein [Candidatus Gracilibacteria bacterium]